MQSLLLSLPFSFCLYCTCFVVWSDSFREEFLHALFKKNLETILSQAKLERGKGTKRDLLPPGSLPQ